MDDLRDLIEHTRRILEFGEALQQSMRQVHDDLATRMALLREELTWLMEKKILTEQQLAAEPSSKSRLLARPVTPPAPAPLPDLVDDGSERRASPRREDGSLVVVLVTKLNPTSPVFEAIVLDRSHGGLALLVDEAIAAGTQLNVRPNDALPSFRWVRMQVKNCRPEGDRWKLGCRFEEKLNPRDLHQFE